MFAETRNVHGDVDGTKRYTILHLRRIDTVIDTNLDVLTDALRPRNVAVISGHMFRGTELDAKAQAEAAIRARAYELFASTMSVSSMAAVENARLGIVTARYLEARQFD